MTDLFEHYSGEPLMLTLCLQENSILVSKAIMGALGQPKQIQMLINDDRKKLLIQACSTDDREAVVIPHSTVHQFEMSGHSLLRRIRKLTGWTDNHPRVIYGTYVSQHNVIVFDLMSAQFARLQMPLTPIPTNPS